MNDAVLKEHLQDILQEAQGLCNADWIYKKFKEHFGDLL